MTLEKTLNIGKMNHKVYGLGKTVHAVRSLSSVLSELREIKTASVSLESKTRKGNLTDPSIHEVPYCKTEVKTQNGEPQTNPQQ